MGALGRPEPARGLERAAQRRRFGFRIEPRKREAAPIGEVESHGTVFDAHVIERDPVGIVGAREGQAEAAPRRFDEREPRPLERGVDHLELAPHESGERDFRVDFVDRAMRSTGGGLADRDAGELEDRPWQEFEIDRPGDRDLCARGGRESLLDQLPMGVPVDEIGADQGRRQDADHQNRQDGQAIAQGGDGCRVRERWTGLPPSRPNPTAKPPQMKPPLPAGPGPARIAAAVSWARGCASHPESRRRRPDTWCATDNRGCGWPYRCLYQLRRTSMRDDPRPSSSGPGRHPLTAKTGVRFPLGAPSPPEMDAQVQKSASNFVRTGAPAKTEIVAESGVLRGAVVCREPAVTRHAQFRALQVILRPIPASAAESAVDDLYRHMHGQI